METQEFFFPPPVVPSRLDLMGRGTLRRSCEKLAGETVPHKMDELPKEVPFIQPFTLDTAHIVRYVDPWDFHLILNSSSNDYLPKKSDWASFLDIDKDFESPAQLFRALTILLSTYVNYLNRHQIDDGDDDIQQNVEYKPGDLVIAVLPRESGEKLRLRYFGYRGVVVEEMKVITEDLKDLKKCYMVYLLDTGEKRLISDIFLRVLPHQFVSFPPLAIKCALHGVSPVGPEWSNDAAKQVLQACTPKKDLQTTVEFYSREPENYKREPYNISSFLTKEPYFVELFVLSRNNQEASINLSELLVNRNLALEWSLFPQRPSIRKEVKVDPTLIDDNDNINWCLKTKPCLITRDESLLLCEPCPIPVKPFNPKEVLFEVARILRLKGNKMPYMSGMQNVMSLLVPDPDHTLRQPCGPLRKD